MAARVGGVAKAVPGAGVTSYTVTGFGARQARVRKPSIVRDSRRTRQSRRSNNPMRSGRPYPIPGRPDRAQRHGLAGPRSGASSTPATPGDGLAVPFGVELPTPAPVLPAVQAGSVRRSLSPRFAVRARPPAPSLRRAWVV